MKQGVDRRALRARRIYSLVTTRLVLCIHVLACIAAALSRVALLIVKGSGVLHSTTGGVAPGGSSLKLLWWLQAAC
jgi:hypothetical protein